MDLIKVKLFKIDSTHNNVRTDTIEGFCFKSPCIDEQFEMLGKGLEFGVRVLRTTLVKSLACVGKSILFETKNSIYTLLIMEDEWPKAKSQAP